MRCRERVASSDLQSKRLVGWLLRRPWCWLCMQTQHEIMWGGRRLECHSLIRHRHPLASWWTQRLWIACSCEALAQIQRQAKADWPRRSWSVYAIRSQKALSDIGFYHCCAYRHSWLEGWCRLWSDRRSLDLVIFHLQVIEAFIF